MFTPTRADSRQLSPRPTTRARVAANGLHLLALAGVSLLGAGGAGDDAEARELKSLQGTWRMVECVNGGGRQDPDLLKSFRLVIKGNVHEESHPAEVVGATIHIDGTKTPKEIDTTFTSGAQKGVTTRGIYKLEGDRLTICRTHLPDHPRPTKFESREFSIVVLIVWERVQPGSK